MKSCILTAGLVIAAALTVAGTSCTSTSSSSSSSAAPESGNALVSAMKIGWNLGNTLDAFDDGKNLGVNSELCWGQPLTTQDMFQNLAASGIKTVRIPITWHNHIVGDGYTIDEAWLARCKQIVDWALEAGLYVIINVHHDTAETASVRYGQGYYPAEQSKEESLAFLKGVWKQIAATFNNGYDNHLLFEVFNEPRLRGHEREWWYDENNADCVAAADIVREYEEACISTIRKSGGKNASRFILVPAYVASPDAALNDAFKMPADSAKNRLILSVHMYTPWSFAGEDPGERLFSKEARKNISDTFDRLYEKFVKKGTAVIVTECGATNKDNPSHREAWFRHFFESAKKNGISAIMWDNGSYMVEETGNYSEHFGYYRRTQGTWYFPALLQAALDGVAAGEAEQKK